MKNFVTVVALTAGAIAAILQIIDWFASKDQKQKITDRLLAGWVWFETQRSGSFIPKVWSRKVQIGLFILYALPVALQTLGMGIYHLIEKRFKEKPQYPMTGYLNEMVAVIAFVYFVALIVAYLTLHRRVMRGVHERQTLRKYFGYLSGRALLFSLALPAQLLIMSLSLIFLPLFLVTIATLPFMLEAFALWTVLLTSVYWVIFSLFAARVFRFAALFLDRALSQEKGVLAGTAALFVAIGALAKAFL
jgi:hypothetical protein